MTREFSPTYLMKMNVFLYKFFKFGNNKIEGTDWEILLYYK